VNRLSIKKLPIIAYSLKNCYFARCSDNISEQIRLSLIFMAYKEKEIEKLYYSIGEVAEQFNVAPSLIRFWESEFELISPKKNRKGNRQFTKEDIDNVRTIYHLVKEKGFTLQGAKDMLKNDTQSVRDKIELLDSLKKVRQFLVEVREKLS
jgi:DNA-binding transcriptional MerR regulator